MTSTLCCSYSRRLDNSLVHRVRTYFNYLFTFLTDWLASKLLEGRDRALLIFVFLCTGTAWDWASTRRQYPIHRIQRHGFESSLYYLLHILEQCT